MRTCFMKYVKFTSILCDNSLSTIMFKFQHISKVYKRMRYHKQTLCPLFVCDIMGIAFSSLASEFISSDDDDDDACV